MVPNVILQPWLRHPGHELAGEFDDQLQALKALRLDVDDRAGALHLLVDLP